MKMPEDIEAERSLLATVLAEGNDAQAQLVLSGLTEDDFVHPQHKALCKAAKGLLEHGTGINAMTLRDRISLNGDSKYFGAYEYPAIVELLAFEEVGRPEVLADILRKHRSRRYLLRVAEDLLKKASDPTQDPLELAQRIGTALEKVGRNTSHRNVGHMAEIIDTIRDGSGLAPLGMGQRLLRFGVPGVDQHIIPGAGSLILVGARPKQYKTTWMIQSACLCALEGGTPLLVSLELKEYELKAAVAAWFSELEYTKWWSAEYLDHPQATARLLSAEEALARIKYFCPGPNTPWSQCESVIRNHKHKYGITSLYLDYFGLLAKPHLSKGQAEYSGWEDTCAAVRRTGYDCDMAMVVLCQINRDGDDKPKSSDLRHTDKLLADCTGLILLWTENGQNVAQVAATRHGFPGDVIAVKADGAIKHIDQTERIVAPPSTFRTTKGEAAQRLKGAGL